MGKGSRKAASKSARRSRGKEPHPDWAVSIALAVGAFCLYIPTFSNDFVKLDDNQYVTENAVVQGGLSPQSIGWAFTTTHFANWLPITWLSHLIDVSLFGLNAGGHHASSALLHAVNSALVYALVRRLGGGVGRSLAVAVLFAVHSLRVESVAWVAERKDVLAATFFLLACLAYVRYVRRGSWTTYALAMLATALSLMSKTMVVTMPAVLLLLDLFPLRRLPRLRAADDQPTSGGASLPVSSVPSPQRGVPSDEPLAAASPARQAARLLLEKVPFIVLSAIAAAWTVRLQQSAMVLKSLSLADRLGNALVSIPRYLRKIAWPMDLAVLYGHPGTWPAVAVVLSAALVAGVTLAALLLVRRRPYLLFGWLLFLGMLVPVSGIVQVGRQSMADRYTYLPGLGLTVAMVWGGAELLRWWRPHARLGAWTVSVVACVLAILTVRQEQVWRNTLTLFEHLLTVEPDNAIAHSYVGTELRAQGNTAAAIGHFQQAIRLDPAFANAYYNLGNAYISEAMAAQRAGNAVIARQYMGQASDAFQKTIDVDPTFLTAHYNLGVMASRSGDWRAAIEHYRGALALDPSYDAAHLGLAEAYLATGHPSEAAGALSDLSPASRADERAIALQRRLAGH